MWANDRTEAANAGTWMHFLLVLVKLHSRARGVSGDVDVLEICSHIARISRIQDGMMCLRRKSGWCD